MRFPWRHLLVVAALMVGTLLLAACGGDDEEKATSPTTATSVAATEVPVPTEAATQDQEMDEILEALLDREWEELRSQIDLASPTVLQPWWTYRISPPFPSVWPPDSGLVLYYYAYAAGFDPGLADAERVATPWGRVEVDPRGRASPKVVILAREIKSIGIQGFSPLTEGQIGVYGMKDAVTNYLATPDVQSVETEQAQQLKMYFCQWTDLNGVIAGEIRPFHQDFFRWLACD